MVINISIYILLTLIVLSGGILCRVKLSYGQDYEVNGEQIYLYSMFLLFTLIMALRSTQVGVDTSPYSRIFKIISEAGSYKGAVSVAPLSAPLYILICRLIALISLNPQILTVISAVIVNFGLFHYIKKVSCNVVLSTFCWIGLSLFYFSMNGNRQCMALVIVINALYYISENIKSLKGWILFLLAIGIHSTSVFAIVAIFGIILVNKLQSIKKIVIVSTLISAITALLLNRIVPLFMRLFPRYSMYGTGESKYSIFQSTGGGRIIFLYIFLMIICILWIYTNGKNDTIQDNFHYRMLPALIFGVIFGIVHCRNELITRMLWFYMAIFISFIPATLEKYKGYFKTILTIGVIVVLVIYSLLSLIENHNGVVPYVFFWN